MDIKSKINRESVPSHVAIIMDGNGRWAKQKGNIRLFGHHNGIKSVREVTEAAAEMGVKYLTLYAFSKENWKRPKQEVSGLMQLLSTTIQGELKSLMENGIRLHVIGDIENLSSTLQKGISNAIEKTKNGNNLNLIIALNYGSRWEITNAVKQIANEVKSGLISVESISEDTVTAHLNTNSYPDPELLIRTGGEYRVSNFLLWQISYAEFYVTNTLWPDFNKNDFYNAIYDFQQRERRFGMTGEQANSRNNE